MRSVMLLGSLLTAIWASLVALILLVEAPLLKLPLPSSVRSIVGIALYFTWAIAWYLAVMRLARIIIKRLPDSSTGEGVSPRV